VRADVAGKTGTTQKNTDGWFILMHPRLVAGCWVGFNDSRITMRSNHWGEGGHNALMVVGDFFQQTLAARLIDTNAEFPFARPRDSIWEPYFEAAKEWLFDAVKDWLFREEAKPLPRRDLQRDTQRAEPTEHGQRELERPITKDHLLERLRQKQAERRQELREME
jgi:penicillin-binding protein 1A